MGYAQGQELYLPSWTGVVRGLALRSTLCPVPKPVSGLMPAPLEERLGRDFFRTLPVEAGVYQFRDDHDGILYVGKAKSLRKRLNSYRVANPERLPRRLLRLLSLTRRIDWELCDGEAAALVRERELLLQFRGGGSMESIAKLRAD